MWHLARSGKTVIWDRRDVMPVMFSCQSVKEGPLEAFHSWLHDPETWCVLFLLPLLWNTSCESHAVKAGKSASYNAHQL